MPRNHRYIRRYPPLAHRRPYYRDEGPEDYFTYPRNDIYNDVYVEDENLSGTFAPTEFENRDDDYEYDYEGFRENDRYDTDNDYGLYSADRERDFGGYGASGYAGPYFGHPEEFARRQRMINRRLGPLPDRYGRAPVYPMPQPYHGPRNYPNPYYAGPAYGRQHRGMNYMPQGPYERPLPPAAGAWERDSRYSRNRWRMR